MRNGIDIVSLEICVISDPSTRECMGYVFTSLGICVIILLKPYVKNGSVVPGNVMKITLSCDHRVVDGASGAAFLNTFKKLMENPVTLILG